MILTRAHGKSIAISFVIFFVFLGVAECGLRIFKPQPTWSSLKQKLGSYYESSDLNTFQLKKRFSGVEPSMEYPGTFVEVHTNSFGLRGKEELQANKKKILVVGDSYTFGVYVSDIETYPAVLQKKIGSPYQVLNAGYAGGFETDQQYVWVKKNIPIIKPKIVILGVFLGNDILGINKFAWRDLDSMGLPSRWLNENLSVTSSGYIRNKVRGIDAVGVERIYGIPILRDLHVCIIAGKVFDRLIAGQVDSYSEESFKHIFGDYSENFLSHEKVFLNLIMGMRSVAESNGAKFIVVLLPINFMVHPNMFEKVLPGSKYKNAESVYYDRLETKLKTKNIPFINVEKLMKNNINNGPFFPSNGEVHFNPRGHEFTADVIFESLTMSGYLDK